MSENQIIYEFADFRVDVKNNLLQQNEKAISITPKVFETLILLLENAGNLIKKNEMMAKIWHDRFVEESNLTFNIKMLRKALGDDANNPKFIENIPRKGYRFIAEVRQISENQPDAEVIQKTLGGQSKKYSIAVIIIVVIGLTVAFSVVFWNKSRSISAPILEKQLASVKLSDTGKTFHPTYSPDGKFVAYVSEVNKKQSLWLRQISSGNNTQILPPTNEIYYGVSFSPDSENIFFTKRLPEERQINIYHTAIFGGIPTKIIENSQGGIKISPDNKRLSFLRYDEKETKKNKLMISDIDGKNESVIRQSTENSVYWTQNFTPDGKTIIAAYGHTNNASKSMKLVEINIETGEQKDLFDDKFFVISSIERLPDQSGFLFTGSETIGDISRIWEANIRTRKIRAITRDSVSYQKISLNQNADAMVAETLAADFRLFVGETANPNNPTNLTQARDGFTFTADGKIVYAGDASGFEDIWIMDADGSNRKQLTGEVSLEAYPIVSPDNRFIVFSSNRDGKNEIWRMDIDGGNQTKISRHEGGYPKLVTPDGKWIYFENALTQIIWKVAFDGSDEQPLFNERLGFYHAFSPDGLQMAFLRKDEETKKFALSVMNLDTKKIGKTYSLPNDETPYFLQWSADGKYLSYLMSSEAETETFWIQDVKKESPTELTKMGDGTTMDCRLNPDGSKFGFIRGSWKHDIVLLKGLK